MKKIILLAVLMLLAQLSGWAKYTIRFAPDSTYTGNRAFGKVSVIDQRPNREYVGSLSSGPRFSKLIPEYGFGQMMTDFASKYYSTAKERTEEELVIAFHAINLEEKSNGEYRIGNLYLHADFYAGSANAYVSLLRIDTLLEFQIGKWQIEDLARIYDRVLANILNNLADKSVATMPADARRYSMEALKGAIDEHRKANPVYYEKQLPGIYYTKEQFLQNKPGDTAFVQQHVNNSQTISDKFFRKEAGKKRGAAVYDSCYAVFNGKQWFRPYKDREFKEMLFRDGEFFYRGKGEGLVLYSNNVGFALGGGIIGYLVAEAVIDKVNKDKDRKGDAVFRYKVGVDGPDVRVERLE